METQKSIVIMNLNVSDAIINHAFMDEFHECGGYLLGQVVEKDSLKYFYVTQIYYEKNIIGKENEFHFSILSFISLAILKLVKSSTSLGLTITLTSLPACIAYVFSTPSKELPILSNCSSLLI